MSPNKSKASAVVFLAAFLFMVVAAACWLGLTALSAPRDYEAREAALQVKLDHLVHLQRYQPKTIAYAPSDVCSEPSDDAADALAVKWRDRAIHEGLTFSRLPGGGEAGRDGADLAPVQIAFVAEGGYDGAVHLLQTLADAKPTVFIDSVSLRSKITSVQLKLTGHFYCWTSDHR